MSRPISDALSPAMRGALAHGHTPQGSTMRGLAARRLAAPGSSRLRLRPTPLGRQVAAMLRDLHVLREALVTIDRTARVLVGTDPGTKAGIDAIHDIALRALARTRRWVP